MSPTTITAILFKTLLASKSDVVDLVGTRIYWLDVPPDVVLPYIVFKHLDGGEDNDTYGRAYDATWRVTYHTDSLADMRLGIDAINTTLHRREPVIPVELEAYVSAYTYIEEQQPVYDRYLVQGHTYFWGGGDYRIRLSLAEASSELDIPYLPDINVADLPQDGEIPIGNGTGWTVTTLTAGDGIAILNGDGSITIEATPYTATAPIDITNYVVTHDTSGVVAGTYTKLTVDDKGHATVGANLTSGDLPSHTHVHADVTDLDNKFASPPTIGNTVANSGQFTTLGINSALVANQLITLIARSATDKLAVIKLASAQTANTLEIRNDSDTLLTSVDSSGRITVIPNGTVSTTDSRAIVVGRALSAVSSQVALDLYATFPSIRQTVVRLTGSGWANAINAVAMYNGTTTVNMVEFGVNGSTVVGGTPTLNYVYMSSIASPAFNNANMYWHDTGNVSIGVNNTTDTSALHIASNTVSKITAILKAFASQTANILEVHNSSNTVLASINSAGSLKTQGVQTAITTKSANYTATVNDFTIVFTANATLSLPSASTVPNTIYVVKCSSGVSVTIDPSGSQTIDGNLTHVATSLKSHMIQSDGSNWWIISQY